MGDYAAPTREMTIEEVIGSLDIENPKKEMLFKRLAQHDEKIRCAMIEEYADREYHFTKAHEDYDRLRLANRALRQACYALSDALSKYD